MGYGSLLASRPEGAEEEHRSAAILDAYEQAKGKDTMMKISIAMGVTQAEADRLGIKH